MEKHYLSDLANSLATASKIAKELGIDISQIGVWRKVIISNTLGHELVVRNDDNLLDATKDGVEYVYIAAHYGKRAQLFLGLSTLSTLSKSRKNHTFIVAFFSENDSSKILSIWSCDSKTIWKEVDRQVSKKALKSKAKLKSHMAFFSESWLRSKKGKGSKLIFKDENI